ncbi:host cell division inhibitor Icd-like protein [Citrobacter braakii]|uniref:host cell division inhibitor Icd-like protein n=1 Tax=Citrobacter freundii complex TaxID=1344959 RepID=UPI000FA2164A|nr:MULTISPECIES: host cell division inhibitor Icd-like protein [Citrobacter freundii complex]MHR62846.1 host cell division inhibitor Icd-like protein [Escherichia coli]HEE9968536.1 host cell division inhibitor Icd-like protein [Citrobacter braakii]ELK1246543.1 host cell division inhibitor Icd-like protein [Citrobacter freundii]ELR9591070.1 host cell division inhibitor Icd-like protein [Citrobacter freundii]MDM7202418.1 host cell division inhibitor Icd-like protein [Citrobacter freundii]
MAKPHSNQVYPKYQYIFLALSRANLQDKPHREDVIACSEREARALLSGRFILSFAGRIPFPEVHND